jgi:hypothetical protein
LDLIDVLQSIRRTCDECIRDHGDPATALKRIAPQLEVGNGLVHDLRPYAAGMGDLWDTLRAVVTIASQMGERGALGVGASKDERLQPATADPTDMGGAVYNGGLGPSGNDPPPDPDD